jgi:hypothetical protein
VGKDDISFRRPLVWAGPFSLAEAVSCLDTPRTLQLPLSLAGSVDGLQGETGGGGGWRCLERGKI